MNLEERSNITLSDALQCEFTNHLYKASSGSSIMDRDEFHRLETQKDSKILKTICEISLKLPKELRILGDLDVYLDRLNEIVTFIKSLPKK